MEDEVAKDIAMELSDRDLYSIYNEYSSSINGIFYYQDQQIELRTICIKVLLGTFAILGALFYNNLNFSSNLYILLFSVIPIFSFFVVMNLLQQDLNYREGLKIGFFTEAIKLEKKHPWVPSFHRCLVSEGNIHQKAGSRQDIFYLIAMGLLLVLSSIGFSFLDFFSSIKLKVVLFSVPVLVFIFIKIRLSRNFLRVSAALKKIKAEKDYYKKSKDSEKFMFVSMLHNKGREYIEHYSSIKFKYKKLVIAVLTALLIGISYISNSDHHEAIHVNKLYLINFLIILPLIGINLIRYLDINISHLQIKLLFNLMIKIERDYKILSKPYVKIKKILYSKSSDPAVFDYLYYGIINVSIIAFGSFIFFINIRDYHPIVGVTLCAISLTAFLFWEILGIRHIYKKKK